MDTKTLDVEGSPMVCATAQPPPGVRSRGGGVIVLHGAYGIDAGVERLGKRFGLAGYPTIAPDLFHRETDPALAPMQKVARLSWHLVQHDLAACDAYLRSAYGVDAVAVLGFCMGGALALMAATLPDVRTVVLFYPHEMYGPFGSDGVVPFDATASIRVPVLGHFGAEDRNPSPADRERLDAGLEAAGIEHELYSYDDANHGFAGGNPERYRSVQTNTAIDRTIGWLDRHLRLGAPAAH